MPWPRREDQRLGEQPGMGRAYVKKRGDVGHEAVDTAAGTP